MKQVKIVFSDESKKVLAYLLAKSKQSKTERMMLKAISKKTNLIKIDKNYGNPIAKKLIPKEYILKHNAKNLFRVELPCFWRMLYTIRAEYNTIEIIAFVIDILDHKNYNKKFDYKNY